MVRVRVHQAMQKIERPEFWYDTAGKLVRATESGVANDTVSVLHAEQSPGNLQESETKRLVAQAIGHTDPSTLVTHDHQISAQPVLPGETPVRPVSHNLNYHGLV